MDEPEAGLNVKISDDELKGRYSNLLRITHTREEFILDFINLAPPQGVVTARIITSPGHLKRIHPRPEREHGPVRKDLRHIPGSRKPGGSRRRELTRDLRPGR